MTAEAEAMRAACAKIAASLTVENITGGVQSEVYLSGVRQGMLKAASEIAAAIRALELLPQEPDLAPRADDEGYEAGLQDGLVYAQRHAAAKQEPAAQMGDEGMREILDQVLVLYRCMDRTDEEVEAAIENAMRRVRALSVQPTQGTGEPNQSYNEILRYVPDLVRNAMLTQWNEICSDTGCHPTDIKRDFEGRRGQLGFEPELWARMAGEMVAANIQRALQSRPAVTDDPCPACKGTGEGDAGECPCAECDGTGKRNHFINPPTTPPPGDDGVERVARALLDHNGFIFCDDPRESGQDAYDITLEYLDDARAAIAALAAPRTDDAQWSDHGPQGVTCELARLDDYESGDPSMELLRHANGLYDFIIYRGDQDLTLPYLRVEAVRAVANRILSLLSASASPTGKEDGE